MNLTLDRVCKSYDGRIVLDHISHVFPEGRITAIVGPSGCGKTTLLHLILGLLTPDGGRILGVPDGAIPTVFQEDRLFESLSVRDNLRLVLPKSYPETRIGEALQNLGLEAALRQPVRELSGGMKRRVALARAMLAEGPLVLLDEPFKGLDARARERAAAFALSHLSGRTALMTTHDPEDIRLMNADVFELTSVSIDVTIEKNETGGFFHER